MCDCNGGVKKGKKKEGKEPSETLLCEAVCKVTISPKDVAICGAGNTKNVTATASPSPGTFAWRSSDTTVATVSGSGNSGTVEAVALGTATVKVTYTVSESGCSCSATANVKVCTCTPGRKYANAKKSVSDLIGIKAKIKTRYGKLCCEDSGGTTNAYQVVYANISNLTGAMIWAQTGYGRERNAGSASIKKYRYAEMKGSTYKVNYDTANAPAEGSIHTYQCDLDKSNGKWTFSYDGTKWQSYADNGWKNKTGDHLQYTGEIYNKEDDMPGTSTNKCSFTKCQYRKDGKAYQDAGLVAADVGIPSPSHDPNEWGEQWISGTALNIWDKKPLP